MSDAPTNLIVSRLGGQYPRLLDEARSCAVRLELNSHLRCAEQARANGNLSAAMTAVDQATEFVRSDSARWGDAWPLLDAQLSF